MINQPNSLIGKDWKKRVIALMLVLLIGLTGLSEVMSNFVTDSRYQLSPAAETLVGEPHSFLKPSLELDSASGQFRYNQGHKLGEGVAGQSTRPKFSASFNLRASDGVEVTDPATNVSIKMKPKFGMSKPRQDQNRLIYPLTSKNAVKVVSLKTVGFKEDILINDYQGDSLKFSYELELPEGTEARLESNGSLAIYGADSVLLGNVSVESEADRELLRSARENAPKGSLLFTLPAPFVKEFDKKISSIDTYFTLEGNELTVHAHGLRGASYPLSIDPSIYVESAAEFMRGNAETNISFDIDSELIKRGDLTGAGFEAWASTLALNQGIWSAGTAASGGHVYSVGGNNGSGNVSDVYWANLNATNYTVTSPNPGAGACTNWCTNSAYNLPEARAGLSLVAYNGYLYAIGGVDGSGNRSNHVYIAKLGANGEPRLWHPTSTDQGNWVYWYRDTSTDLSSERSYLASVAYDGRLYVLGGETDLDPSGITTVEYADLRPNGTFGSWSTSGMSVLPVGAGRHHHTVEVYNDTIYIIGGVEGTVTTGNIVGNVFYARLADGTMNGWTQTSSLSSSRMTWGGSFTAIWNGHIYQAGGCSAVDVGVNLDTYCTAIEQTTQFASINAQGNLAPWKTVSGGNAQYMGHSLAAWNGALYRIGGCSAQDSATGNCSTAHDDVSYAPINAVGDISAVSMSSPNSSGTCSGSEPYNCDLPPPGDSAAGQGGQILTASAIVKGYLYVIGGCVNTGCTNVSGNVSYTEIAPDGTLSQPEDCADSYYGSWCVDSTNRVNGTTGVAAAGVVTFGDTVYIVGGVDGSTNTNAVYRNTIEDDGSLSGSWASQSLTGVGATSVAHTFAYSRANPASAGTNPGNLYIFGGCFTTSAASCTGNNYSTTVYKCDIQTSGAIANCSTSSQLQIDSDLGSGGSQGLGLHSGTVYANYIYLVGGYSQTESDKDTVLYAQFDDSNNVVAVSAGQWTESSSTLATGQVAGYSFGHNGYLYAVGGYRGSIVGDDVQFAKIDPSDGSLGAFAVPDTTIDPRWGSSVAVSSSKVYIMGGCASGAGTGNCSALEETVRTVQIHNNESGAPESYSPSTNLFNTDRIAASSAILDGYIYVAGGCTDSATCATITDDVQYASLDAYGNIGGWSAASAALPEERAWGQLEAVGGTLYYIGGQDESADESADVFYATPSSGDVSSWSAASNGMPAARAMHGAAVWNDRIYATGGNNASGVAQSTVYVSPQLSSGGNITSSWSTSTAFDVARSGLTAVAYGNNLYVLGGFTGSTYLSDVQFAKINSDGTVGDWSFTTSLPLPIQQGDGFASNGYIYLFGGRSGNDELDCQNRTFIAPINANTALVDGNNPTGLGRWYESNARFGSKRYGIAASHYEGKAYLLGGGCAALLNEQEIYSTAGEHTFISPEETTQVVVEAWGGGGGGGSGENGGNNAAGAGGGGGGYARETIPVSPGNYTVTVGAGGAGGVVGSPGNGVNNPGSAGGGSWFDTSSTVFGAGGSGAGYSTSSGSGGTANIGSDATFNGGNGGTGHASASPSNRRGGGGGGSAFNDASGNNGANGTGSAGSGAGGSGTGNGGDGGVNTGIGGAGNAPGAGGAGGGYRGSGGAGADGRVIVHYQEWSDLVLAGSDRVSVATLLSQPQVARYSRMIDTDTDVFPAKWLLNGLDNVIGGRWNMAYRSSTAAAAVWGWDTNFGEVTLSQPEDYIPLDGSGANSNFARYYYMSMTVDDSQTYGYPDDVTRSPTITDLSLFFTSDPGKRLRHGKTFTGGEQQPLDTPF